MTAWSNVSTTEGGPAARRSLYSGEGSSRVACADAFAGAARTASATRSTQHATAQRIAARLYQWVDRGRFAGLVDRPTTVNLNSDWIYIDVAALESNPELMPVMILILTDLIWRHVSRNIGVTRTLVVLDEAYSDFCDDPDYPDGVRLLTRHPRLVVLRTFSKLAGLAGLRVGYAAASAETIDRLNRVRAPYNVNRLGQVAALAALEDHAHLERTRTLVLEERAFLSAELVKRGYVFPPSQANFLLVRVPDPAAVRARLLRAGILVRDGASVGFPGHLRFSIGLRTTNEKLLSLL